MNINLSLKAPTDGLHTACFNVWLSSQHTPYKHIHLLGSSEHGLTGLIRCAVKN